MAMATIDTNGDATYDFITPAAFEYQDDALMKLLSPHDNESNDAPLDYDDDTRITISSTTSNNLVYIMGTMAARLRVMATHPKRFIEYAMKHKRAQLYWM